MPTGKFDPNGKNVPPAPPFSAGGMRDFSDIEITAASALNPICNCKEGTVQ